MLPSTDSVIAAVGPLPWGTHFCQFYETKHDLVETLVPYFAAGIKANEACLWVTSEPLEAEESAELMTEALPEFKRYLDSGQIEIRSLQDWYRSAGSFQADRVLQGWIDRQRDAQARGFAGLRLTGNTFWLERANWDDFVDYEQRVNNTFGRYRMVALCTYCLSKCSASDVVDVVRNHEFALARRAGQWEMVENASITLAKAQLAQLNGELEHRVEIRTAALQQALREREEFIAMLAHELRNPLAPIRNAARAVRAIGAAQPALAGVGEVIDRQITHLARMVDDLLDTARLTSGAAQLHIARANLSEVIAQAVELAREQLDARRHRFAPALPDEPVQLEVDATRVVQIVANLLDNAAKYTPDGGDIALDVHIEADTVVARISDTGVGIAPDMLERVFDPFVQIGRALDRSQGGVGLGLALVRRLAEMHGGSITLESQPGRGTQATLRLPVRSAGSPPSGEATEAADGRRNAALH